MAFFTGSKPKIKRVSNLSKKQQRLENQLINSAMGEGGGGAFGTAADYYRSLLSGDSDTFNAMAAPELRRFREQIVPELSEQFAGMGAGGLSSSGFRNAAVSAGTDLSERLGAIRAQLRQQGAQGLQDIGRAGLENRGQLIEQPGSQGFLGGVAPALGSLAGSFLGPVGTAAGEAIGSGFNNWLNGNMQKGSTSPYGGLNPPQRSSSLPNFDWNMRR